MYKIVITEKAVKDLKNIDKETKNRLAKKMLKLSKTPLKHAQKLINPKIGEYRFRIGDYRVIFDIDFENIVILRIGHRKKIYK